MLPGKATDPGATAADNRQFLEAVLWRTRTGSPWRDLLEHFGNWSVFKRFRRSAVSGVFKYVFNKLSDEFDLDYVFIDGMIVQAHQKASGARGDPQSRHRPFPGRPDQQDRGGSGTSGGPTAQDPDRGQGVRCELVS